jgi:hypothetical protein
MLGRRFRWSVAALLAAGVNLLSASALAQDEGAKREPGHDGVLLRFALGLGGAAMGNNEEPDIVMSGGAGFFSIDLGGTLKSGLALHGRLSVHAMVEPSVEIDGDDVGELQDSTVSFYLLGVGATYYFPSNLYLTGVLGISQATIEIDGFDEIESETGGGFAGDIGYEWGVGGDWGLGLAGRFELYAIPDADDQINAAALGLLFTATYH